ncbi:hypothetical protein Vretimale_3713 [Volvox reticuliferus]|uniref:BRCT domain-containing protein n=1 Tax=Volvox reticuliferus TaxID=1737510 RepID=A0A8J4DF22_9CHLO|nr:hypothetical protein Vretifemale_1323 [Volvox reticuliferus]GIL98324.1 hypothetical protein Vretimale_3713 [Volvox reticuliferus]
MSYLHGKGIVFGNTAPHNIQDLTEAASALGATVYSALEASNASYLIANSVLRLFDGTDPYLTSLKSNPNLTVVSTEWLSACQAEQRQVPTSPYLLGPFSGIKASITNFGAKERDVVVNQLKQGSANYSPELFRHTTHLVGNRPGGNKYTHAREWGLFIVHHDWVIDCLRVWRRLDERRYSLETYIPKETSIAAQAATGDYQRQPSRTVSSARGGVSCQSGDGAGAQGASIPVRQATASILGVVAPGPTDSVTGGPLRNTGAVVAVLRSTNGLAPTGTDGAGSADEAKDTTYTSSLAQPVDQYYRIPAVPPDDCYFLHWVRLWVVGCTSSEQSHVLAAVRESGATREPALHAGVTHIVFGSVLSTADLAEVRQHLSEHREQVKLARLRWLYECVERRSYMEPDGPYAMTVAQLLLAQGGTGMGQLVPAQSGRVGHRSRESSPPGTGQATVTVAASAANTVGAGRLVAPLDDYVPLDPEALNRTMDSISVRSASTGVFAGLWFTLVAVAGTEEEPTATKLVRQGGGMIMSASTEKTVREPQRRYAVCPFSLPQMAVDRICSNRGRERGPSEFEKVPVEQRVTVAWLRACVSRGELLQVKRETPLFRPLPHALPLQRFQGVIVAVSQYHVEQREVLEQLISRLGGTYTEKLNKRCHYLVIQDAHGEKFTHAIKWGIPCVRADWVLESAYAGRPLDDQLIAFLPAGITPAEMEERRAAASRARSCGGGPSQLGPTQRPLQLEISQLPVTVPVERQQDGSQCHVDGRLVAPLAGLPPRPNQAPDRHGASTQMPQGPQTSGQLPSLPNPVRPPLSMAPPPTSTNLGVGPEAPLAAARTAATGAIAKPPSILQPVIKAILEDESGKSQEGGSSANGPLQASDPGRASAIRGTGATEAAEPSVCKSLGVTGRPGLSNTTLAAGATDGSTTDPHKPPPQLDPSPELCERQAEGGTQELDGVAAMLMQFLDKNKFVPEVAFSQLDLPMQLPIPAAPPGAGEGSTIAAGASSMPSREPGSSVLSLKTADGDSVGGRVGGRRSRKRAAAAAVGEPQDVPEKVGGLPGRRSRNDEEEEGFGVVMSQQVSYEAAAAAPPPRVTRSTMRGRGGGGTEAKENLIKAVQGNMR